VSPSEPYSVSSTAVIERLFVVKVIVQHRLVDLRSLGDVLGARAGETVFGEGVDRRPQRSLRASSPQARRVFLVRVGISTCN
jgi:hypothetical protein